MIAHIVLFRPKADVSSEERHHFIAALERACREAPSVRRATAGRARAGGSQHDYPYAAILEFDDLEGLRAYLDHPTHSVLRTLFWKTCDATVIVDVECGDLTRGLAATWLE